MLYGLHNQEHAACQSVNTLVDHSQTDPFQVSITQHRADLHAGSCPSSLHDLAHAADQVLATGDSRALTLTVCNHACVEKRTNPHSYSVCACPMNYNQLVSSSPTSKRCLVHTWLSRPQLLRTLAHLRAQLHQPSVIHLGILCFVIPIA